MAVVKRLEDGKPFQMGRGNSRRVIDAEIGAENITMNYSIFQPGHEFPQHIHDRSADVFIVLEGGVSVREGERYTPIRAGDLAYIPAGEVHGTVNQTDAVAVLISFQSPPDDALYRGERDSSRGGDAPRPTEGHGSRVIIRQLQSGSPSANQGVRAWAAVSPAIGAHDEAIDYVELEPGASFSVPSAERSESVWFVWSGEATFSSVGKTLIISEMAVAFVPAGEAATITNRGASLARLIRCVAPPV